MADHPNTEAPPPDTGLPAPDRHAAIEHLLLNGFDHYFAGRYEHAVHVWTRVLFLDRTHPRARAYIERARRAIAEGQRQSEALLEGGLEAFADGDADRAKRLLTSAIQHGTGDEVAMALLRRLERRDLGPPAGLAVATVSPGRPAEEAIAAPTPSGRDARWHQWLLAGVTIGLLAAAAYAVTAGDAVTSWLLAPAEIDSAVDSPAPSDPLPVPDVSLTLVERARSLYARGRAEEALRALDAVRDDDAGHSEADRLRVELQNVLLGTMPSSSRSASRVEPSDR